MHYQPLHLRVYTLAAQVRCDMIGRFNNIVRALSAPSLTGWDKMRGHLDHFV